jgi:hypothetical protein
LFRVSNKIEEKKKCIVKKEETENYKIARRNDFLTDFFHFFFVGDAGIDCMILFIAGDLFGRF